eukprot:TRINITY_DN8633_c1_g1_i1.p1 TRINITY_DN8633_c1_g1~~TRINITY_DN8633_c1_g1_i1.p1  ORF type:complete len:554 (+),score=122.80 TRINITY_DN8633_c1_g1_i1:36-1664(+)
MQTITSPIRATVLRVGRRHMTIAKDLFKGSVSRQLYPYPDGDENAKFYKGEVTAKTDIVELGKVLREAKAVGGCKILEGVGKGDLGVGLNAIIHETACQTLISCGKADVVADIEGKNKILGYCLTEETSGTDPSSVTTTAALSEDGQHYILNGRKSWVVNGSTAEYLVVYATASTPDGKRRLTSFLVDRKDGGVTNGPRYPTMGLASTSLHDLEFKNVKVPVGNVIGEVGGGHRLALQMRVKAQHHFGGLVLGGHKKVLEEVVRHANDRKAFGRKLRDLALIKQRVAGITMRIYAGESMLYLLAKGLDEEGKEHSGIESAIVKNFITRTALESLDDAAQVLGGVFYLQTNELNGLFRDLNAFRAVGGTEEINRLYLALSGLEVSGKHLSSKSTWKVILDRTKKSLGMVASSSGHHPSLKQAAGILDKHVSQASTAFEAVLIKFGKRITDEQIVVAKVAQVVTLLYSMAAVLSRASKAASTSCPSAQHEIVLATTWVRQCTPTLDILTNDIKNIFKTLDSNLSRIADHVSDMNGYIPVHPTEF